MIEEDADVDLWPLHKHALGDHSCILHVCAHTHAHKCTHVHTNCWWIQECDGEKEAWMFQTAYPTGEEMKKEAQDSSYPDQMPMC